MNVRHVCKWCVVVALVALGSNVGLNKVLSPHRRARRVPSKGCKCSRAGRSTRPSRKP